jgi:hypothetical protein
MARGPWDEDLSPRCASLGLTAKDLFDMLVVVAAAVMPKSNILSQFTETESPPAEREGG